MTHTEKDNLVERLRGECRDYTGEMIDPRSTTREEVHCSLLYEAATRIIELERELAEAREAALEEAAREVLSSLSSSSLNPIGRKISRLWLMNAIKDAQAAIRDLRRAARAINSKV